jgi:predicted O-methyltransferase YrrM
MGTPARIAIAASAAVGAGGAVAVFGLADAAPVLVGAAVLVGAYGADRLRANIRAFRRQMAQLTAKQDALRQTQAKVLGQAQEIRRKVEPLAAQATQLARREDVRRLRQHLDNSAVREFRQVEALLNLHAVSPLHYAVPPSRGWAASPDLLLLLTWIVATERPRVVVDLGSGNSTLWLGLAMRSYGVAGKVVALDHDESYARATRDVISLHGITDFVDVRHAPLTEVKLSDEVWPWYDPATLDDIFECDLVVVDGPPGITRSHARYPALPLLSPRLSARALIVVDDCVRSDERDIVTRWQAEYPGWRTREYPHEKRTMVLRRETPLSRS